MFLSFLGKMSHDSSQFLLFLFFLFFCLTAFHLHHRLKALKKQRKIAIFSPAWHINLFLFCIENATDSLLMSPPFATILQPDELMFTTNPFCFNSLVTTKIFPTGMLETTIFFCFFMQTLLILLQFPSVCYISLSGRTSSALHIH